MESTGSSTNTYSSECDSWVLYLLKYHIIIIIHVCFLVTKIIYSLLINHKKRPMKYDWSIGSFMTLNRLKLTFFNKIFEAKFVLVKSTSIIEILISMEFKYYDYNSKSIIPWRRFQPIPIDHPGAKCSQYSHYALIW